MKKDIHPKNYRLVVFKDISNDYTFISHYMRINKSKKLKLVKTIKLKKANTYTITIKLGKKAKYTIFGIAFNGKNKSKASKQIKIKI